MNVVRPGPSVLDGLEFKEGVFEDDQPGVSFTIVWVALAYVHLTERGFTFHTALVHVCQSTLATGQNQ